MVTNCTESALRAALVGGGHVRFDCDGTVVLTNTLVIAADTIIDATGRSVSLSGNQAVRILRIDPGASLTLSNLTLTLGKSAEGGNAVANLGGSLRAWHCVFATNTTANVGGAIYKGGLVVLNHCSFIGNRAEFLGGAIGSNDANTNSILATNCTFFGNSSPRGGAIQGLYGDGWALNCTFASNGVTTVHLISGAPGTVTLRNCIVAGNAGTNCVGVLDGGNNLISDDSVGFTHAFSLTRTDPQLGPLAMNGGSTPTLLPQPNSPAIDAGDDANSPPLDQRGVVRPSGLHVDIGAVESQTSGTQAGTVRFGATTIAASENSGTVAVAVARAGGSAGTVTVDFSTSNGTAVAGTDYQATNGTLTFLAGELSKSFLVRVLNDNLANADRSLNLRLSHPTGGASLGLSNAVVVIQEDDSQITLGAPGYSVLERSGLVTVPVFRVGNTSQTVSVQFATADSSALAGDDYVATNGVLVFLAGQATRTITIRILNDQTPQGNRVAMVALSQPTPGLVLGSNPSTALTIIDDDLILGNCTEPELRIALGAAESIHWGCDGTLVLSNSVVLTQNVFLNGNGHQVTLSGGGVLRPLIVNSGIQLTLKGLTVANGFAEAIGGGLLNNGTARIIDCTFTNNVVLSVPGSPAVGAAIYHGLGALELTRSAFLNNRAIATNSSTARGGAVGGNSPLASLLTGPISVTNCTFSGNGSGAISVPAAFGENGPIRIVNSTFAGNTGGALSYGNLFGTNAMTVFNSIFGANHGPNLVGVTDGGFNISSDDSGPLTHPFSVQNINPRLGPTGNNGGPTLTIPLLVDSPAIEGGNPSLTLATDQRGVLRPFGSIIDAGAFEATYPGNHPGVIQFAQSGYPVQEGNQILTVTLVRVGGASGSVAIQVFTTNRTAMAGADFVGTNGLVVFAPGERTNTFAIHLLEDAAVEGTEWLEVALANPTGGAALGRASTEIRIFDNDASFSFTTNSLAVAEAAGTVSLTVRRAGDTSMVHSVNYATSSGTADGADYPFTTGMLTFSPGQILATFNVPIRNDAVSEPDEAFNVTLSAPSAGAILANPTTAVVTILDDDGVRVVSDCSEESLRFALSIGGRIRLDCDGTILLTNTVTVNRNASLEGMGHQIALSGNHALRVLSVPSGIEFSIKNLTIANGQDSGLGGGGVANLGTFNAEGCTFIGNQSSGFGGAILNQGTLRVLGCAFLTNSSGNFGAAIASGYGGGPGPSGPAFLTNCTFAGNNAPNASTLDTAFAGPTFVVNCTIAGNFGVGVSSATIINTILFANSAGNCQLVTDGGHNLSSDNSGNFTTPFSLNNANPKLGALSQNGGPTLTFPLLPGSPAIDAADASASPPLDQRGVARPYGAGYDIGAFEATVLGLQPGILRLVTASLTVSESETQIVIMVLRESGAAGTVTVNFATANQTATAGADYFPTNGTLTFAAGEVSKSFTVSLQDDAVEEADETFTVRLSSPTGGATVGSPGVMTVTLRDDESSTSISTCDDASLRAAIATRPLVRLNCDGVIVLTNALVISGNTRIDASGHTVALSGGGATRLFIVESGATLSLQHLILQDGLARGTNGAADQPGGSAPGGAILVKGGAVIAADCAFLRNRAQGGQGGPSSAVFNLQGAGGAAMGGVLCSLNGGSFKATNCVFTGNTVTGGNVAQSAITQSVPGGHGSGGAFFMESGLLQLAQCLVSSNQVASGQGSRFGGQNVMDAAQGGALRSVGGEVRLSRVNFRNNSCTATYFSGANGGAISQSGGLMDLIDSYLDDNRVQGSFGPGIGIGFGWPGAPAWGGNVYLSDTRAVVERSTLRRGLALGGGSYFRPGGPGFGGGLSCNQGTDLTLTNSTLVQNEARAGSSGVGSSASGGGIHCADSALLLSHVTIVSNAASRIPSLPADVLRGGGLHVAGGTATLQACIIAHSLSGSNAYGALMDEGHNISSDASCQFTAPGSLNNTDPKVGPLDDYSGPTPTMALLPGSPALDAASLVTCPPTDQRGRVRPFGANCDIGAFESSAPYSVLGTITGYLPPAGGISVQAGPLSGFVDGAGRYSVHGFTSGTHQLTPSSADSVFVPSNRVLNVAWDMTGVNFYSYRSNALTLDLVAGPAVHGVFAGEIGQTYQVLVSPDASSWTPWSTNTVGASGLFEFFDDTLPARPQRFFEVVRP